MLFSFTLHFFWDGAKNVILQTYSSTTSNKFVKAKPAVNPFASDGRKLIQAHPICGSGINGTEISTKCVPGLKTSRCLPERNPTSRSYFTCPRQRRMVSVFMHARCRVTKTTARDIPEPPRSEFISNLTTSQSYSGLWKEISLGKRQRRNFIRQRVHANAFLVFHSAEQTLVCAIKVQ